MARFDPAHAADREWANRIRGGLFVIGFAGSNFDSEVVMVGNGIGCFPDFPLAGICRADYPERLRDLFFGGCAFSRLGCLSCFKTKKSKQEITKGTRA